MKKNQLIKALVFTAVLAAFPAAGLSASAEDAAPADALAIDTAAPVAAQAEDVVLAPVEAAPVEVAPVVVEAAPAVDDAAAVTAEGTDGKDTPGESKINPAPAPAPAPVDTTGTIKLDDTVIKAGESAKISADVKAGKYVAGQDANGKDIIKDYKVGVRYYSSDNSIATVDPDGTVHAKKAGKVTIYAVTEDGTEEIVMNVSESYNVLLIDRTDSTNGKTLAKEKAAAISYAEEVLKVNSESHVAVVQIGDQRTTKTLSSFTNNLKDIKNTINGITAGSEYSVYSAGIKEAASLLNSIPNYNQDKTNQNVLIFGDGACTIGDRDYAKAEAEKLINGTNANNGNAVTLYTFGVYDGATDAEKAEGSAFMKDLGTVKLVDANGNVIKVKDKEVTESFYYEVGDVKDLKDTYKAILTKPVRTKNAASHIYVSDFDVVVYGKDCAKKCKCKCDGTAAAKKSSSEANSPETAESNSIYVIALFALLGAGAMGVSAKKRFED